MRPQMGRKIATLFGLALFLFTLIILPIYYPKNNNVHFSLVQEKHCDLTSGEWAPNPEAPYYTNMTCNVIQEFQNCMKYGRPDTHFLKWKWKPDGCELPIFDANQFLQIVRGKSMAFVGDSVARNHMQSLICLLSKVANPVTTDEIKSYEYREYNFNISLFWSPNLIRVENVISLYLDEIDESWTTKIQNFDYVIISAGNWFFHPVTVYLNHHIVSQEYSLQYSNVSDLTKLYFSYRMAFRTAFRVLNNLKNYKGVTILRTFSPPHFENGTWEEGGDCTKTRPYKRKEKVLEDSYLEFYKIQLQEFEIARKEGRKKGLKFRLLDVTRPMLLRPDGHPSKYGHSRKPNDTRPITDCLHWCLPGPIDVWNDFLLKLLKRERRLG